MTNYDDINSPRNKQKPVLGNNSKIPKFTYRDIINVGCVPEWALEESLHHPLWKHIYDANRKEDAKILSLEDGFRLAIFGQIVAFGLTLDQAEIGLQTAEEGLVDMNTDISANSAAGYKGKQWLPDQHLIISSWSYCAVAHKYQLRETENLVWRDLETGEAIGSMYASICSIAIIQISDLYSWLMHILPEEFVF